MINRYAIAPALASLVALVLVLFAGCYSRPAAEEPIKARFQRLHNAMSLKEVEDILGTPTNVIAQRKIKASSSLQIYSWKQGNGSEIVILFRNGRADIISKTQSNFRNSPQTPEPQKERLLKGKLMQERLWKEKLLNRKPLHENTSETEPQF